MFELDLTCAVDWPNLHSVGPCSATPSLGPSLPASSRPASSLFPARFITLDSVVNEASLHPISLWHKNPDRRASLNQSSVGLHRENDHSNTNSKPKCSTTTLLLPFSSPVWLFVLVRTKPNKFRIKKCAKPMWTIASRQRE